MILLKIRTYLIKGLSNLILIIPITLFLIELAYLERGYIAIGGELLITLIIFIWRCKNG